MDDNRDTFEILTNAIEALRLAGVERDVIANHLFVKFIEMREESGLTIDEIAEQCDVFLSNIEDA